jgi:hypothetical protein
MRNLLPKLLVLAVAFLPVAAHADTLDVTLIGGAHTFTFTLPSQFSFPDQLHLVTVPTIRTTGTADGVAGQTFDVTFFSGIASIGDSLIFADVSAFTSFLLTGPVLISPLPQTGTPGHLIDTAAIATGYFILGDNDIISPKDPIAFALTITPQAAATAEPSTLLLLATGLATGMIGLTSANPRPKPTLPAKN